MEKKQSLSDAAKIYQRHLSKGQIVTAELKDGNASYSITNSNDPDREYAQKILFEIGSVSKVFNGLLLAQSVVDGQLSLDDQVKDLLPDLNFTDSRVGRIELRQLVTHSSGLPDFPDNFMESCDPSDPYAHYDRYRLRTWLERVQLKGEAPFEFQYSNFGVALLAMVLTETYQKSWEVLIREKVTQPLGLVDTAVDLTDEQAQRFAPPYLGEMRVKPMRWTAVVAAGGLKSTAEDLVKFAQALLSPEQTSLNEAIKLMLSPQVHMENMGLGIFSYKGSSGSQVYGHVGGTTGHRCVFEISPSELTANIVLVNNFLMDGRLIIEKSYENQTRYDQQEHHLDRKLLSEYVGRYKISSKTPDYIQDGEFIVELKGSQLMIQLVGSCFLHPQIRLFSNSNRDQFFTKEPSAGCEFVRINGKISSLVYSDLFQVHEKWKAQKTQ
ncbi:serine hydrolase domain-containing protein [Persicirhabdus sediminis]|uniref:Beta-lactamase n=1 Tax=Persicirhabdus sediminis TaxID=454144 RepID=A0A8J7SHW1_9BACT|nr:serine hydrolase [Persicirhabdus sediminis]MBK1790046.1 serine hydrolase [Persicirhabdus sediminis]